MKTLIAIAGATLLAAAAPAFAQNAPAPGAANSSATPADGGARMERQPMNNKSEGRASATDLNPGAPGNNHNDATRNNGQ